MLDNKFFYVIISLILLACLNSFGQDKFASDRFLTRLTNNAIIDGLKYDGVEGTPYLNSDFVDGIISINYGKHSCPLRYNIHVDQMEFLQNGKIFGLDPNSSIRRIEMGTRRFVVRAIISKGGSKAGFIEQLDSGKMSIYIKYDVDFTDAVEPSAMKYEGSPAKFSKVKSVYFYSINDGPTIRVEAFKKLIQDLPDKQKELTLFVKDEKLSSNKVEDLRRFVEYYNLH